MKTLLFACLFLFIISECPAQLAPGKVIDSVFCLEDSEQSYALYLPSNYRDSIEWPAIFIFEPAARGNLPVKRFRPVAEELGYILISSNNSRNGSWEVVFDAAEALFSDAAKRYAVDASRIYTAGFSGGARAATALAVITNQIAGVIACGAGLPNPVEYQPNKAHRFDYVSVAGIKDMNYLELKKVAEKLDELGFENHQLWFDGGHTWPPSHYLKQAVYWLELQQVKRAGYNPYYDLTTAFDIDVRAIDSLLESSEIYSAVDYYYKIIENYKEQIDLTPLENKISPYIDGKEFKKQAKRQLKIERQEARYQGKYFEAFSEAWYTRLSVENDSTIRGIRWWQNEIDELRSLAKKENGYLSMSLRLLNLIWAKFAEASFKFQQQGDTKTAITFNEIWLYADPSSVWGSFNMAKLHGLEYNKEKTMYYLNMAHELGMSRPERIKKQPEFSFLKNEAEYIELLQKLN
ncbi:MAG: hypothetical protein AAGG59_01260 [Bacteroidota bacterium]